MMNLFQRRQVLRALGIGGGSFVLPSLMPRAAKAATAPKRFLWFWSGHGTLAPFWSPKAGTETDFALNDLLTPLEPYKKDLLLLDGLDMKDRLLPGYKAVGNAHQQGQNSSIAGIDSTNDALAGGPSFDQLLAKANAGKTKFASLELGGDGRDGNKADFNFPNYGCISYSGAGQRLPHEGDPQKVLARVFGSFTVPGGGQPPTPAPTNNTAKRQKSILDYVGAEIAAITPKLSANDKQKLESHASGIRSLETSLSFDGGAGTAGAVAGMGCGIPKQPGATLTYDALGTVMANMVSLIFACDLTRVISVPFYVPEDSTSGYTNGAFGTTDLHDLAHKTPPTNGSLRDNPAAMAMMAAYQKQNTIVFKKFLDGLAGITDVDGKRLLDNTAVLWSNELGDGGHRTEDCKWLLAGSAGGAIKTGRWLKYNNAPHQNVYVSLGQAMGLDINSFGDARSCTGKLPGF